MKIQEGDTVQMELLGTVRVKRIYPNGAAQVVDCEDRNWLVPRDMVWTVETGLFSFTPQESVNHVERREY